MNTQYNDIKNKTVPYSFGTVFRYPVFWLMLMPNVWLTFNATNESRANVDTYWADFMMTAPQCTQARPECELSSMVAGVVSR